MNSKENKEWRDKNRETIKQLYDSGLTAVEIAEKYGIGPKRIFTILKGHEKRTKSFYASGERNNAWKGGRVYDKDGYVLVYAPEHPHRTRHNQVREHRLVVEGHLGRLLEPYEVVDHINGVKDDNRLENLRVFSSNREHLAVTRKGKCPKWSDEGLARLRASAEKKRKVL